MLCAVSGHPSGAPAPAPADTACAEPVDELVTLARELPVLGALARVARRAIRRAAGTAAMPEAQVEVLRVVEASPGIGTGGVAEQLQLVPNTVSTLVGELVAAGLPTRERDGMDRRVARLHLTPAAVDQLAQWNAIRDQVVSRALAQLDPADRDALAAALSAARRMLALLDAAEQAAAATPTAPTATRVS
jgi:DNA-binding MarR family transcriptional regulator